MSGIPPWMEDVAKAGGFEEHAKLKAQQELMDTMNKMPPEKFFQLKDMLGSLERMLDTGGSDLGILSGLKDSITDTIKTEFDAVTAEFQNSLNTLINTALEPIMPYIQVALQGITSVIGLSFSGLTAVLTGKWEDFENRLEGMFPGITEWRDEFRVSQTNLFWGGGLGTAIINANLAAAGLPSVAELNAQGIAGGTYSGQFDIDPDALAAMLENLEIPTFTED